MNDEAEGDSGDSPICACGSFIQMRDSLSESRISIRQRTIQATMEIIVTKQYVNSEQQEDLSIGDETKSENLTET